MSFIQKFFMKFSNCQNKTKQQNLSAIKFLAIKTFGKEMQLKTKFSYQVIALLTKTIRFNVKLLRYCNNLIY